MKSRNIENHDKQLETSAKPLNSLNKTNEINEQTLKVKTSKTMKKKQKPMQNQGFH